MVLRGKYVTGINRAHQFGDVYRRAFGCPMVATFNVLVEDKIVGKAAALLLVRIGIRQVKAGVLSKLAKGVLERYGVRFSSSTIVERIDCQTESLLADVEDPEQAYRIIMARAGR